MLIIEQDFLSNRNILRGKLKQSPETVYALAFGAHPDDVELSCGATLLKIIGEGQTVAVCDLTRGEMGTLGTPKLFNTEENLAEIIKVNRQFRPHVVFANAPDERHPDHIKASRLVTDACYYAGLQQLATSINGNAQEPHRPKHLLYYIQFKHLEPDIIVDISETFEASRKGVLAFSTQFYKSGITEGPRTLINRPEFLTALEARARYFGEQIGVLYGEGFKLSSILGVRSFTGTF